MAFIKITYLTFYMRLNRDTSFVAQPLLIINDHRSLIDMQDGPTHPRECAMYSKANRQAGVTQA